MPSALLQFRLGPREASFPYRHSSPILSRRTRRKSFHFLVALLQLYASIAALFVAVVVGIR